MALYRGFEEFFYYLEPHVVSRIAQVASNAQQLTPRSMPLVCTPDCRQLVLYATSLRDEGDHRDKGDHRAGSGLDSLLARAVTGEAGVSTEGDGASGDKAALGMGVDGGGGGAGPAEGFSHRAAHDARGEASGEASEASDEADYWLDRLDAEAGFPAPVLLRGCHSLTSLTLWTPAEGGLDSEALNALAVGVPTLTQLHLPACFPVGEHYQAADGECSGCLHCTHVALNPGPLADQALLRF